jgi:hypothetical protein
VIALAVRAGVLDDVVHAANAQMDCGQLLLDGARWAR